MTPVDEAKRKRVWRERCAEPQPGNFPVRCRRDLGHPDGHIGFDSRMLISDPNERPMRWVTWYVSWPGVGNQVSAAKALRGARSR